MLRVTARSGRLLPPSAVRRRGGEARQRPTATDWRTGLNVSPGAAVGQIALDADIAERWAKEGKDVIMVRPETKPDDVHGMLAARGILTSRGGRTSHAALVARQFGKPAVVGVASLEIDLVKREIRVAGRVLRRGRKGVDRRHDRAGLRRQAADRGARHQGCRTSKNCSAGRTDSAASRCGPTPTIRSTPSAPANMAPRVSASAAPSTCSSSPSVCRTCSA